MNNISYFNQVSREIFDLLYETKYYIGMMEINEQKKFIGIYLNMNQYSAQIVVMTPDNPKYIKGNACSMQMYDVEDLDLQEPLFEVIAQPILNVINFLVEEEITEDLCAPKFNLN